MITTRAGTGTRDLGDNLLGLPYASSSFDVVTSFDVLYRVGRGRRQAVRELGAVLKPGGLIVRCRPQDSLGGA